MFFERGVLIYFLDSLYLVRGGIVCLGRDLYVMLFDGRGLSKVM